MYKITIEKQIKETQEEQKYPRMQNVFEQTIDEINLWAIIQAINLPQIAKDL